MVTDVHVYSILYLKVPGSVFTVRSCLTCAGGGRARLSRSSAREGARRTQLLPVPTPACSGLCSRHLTAAHPIGSSRLRVMARAAPVHPHRWRLLLLLAAVICTTPHASANSTVSWIQKRADMRHAMWGSRVLTNRSHPDQVPSLSLPPSLSLSLSLSPPPPPAPCLPPSLPPFLPASLLSLSAFTNYCSPS